MAVNLNGAASAPFSFKSVLHVGCGGDPLPEWMLGAIETRLDIDKRHNPHIVADMTHMGEIGRFDAVICQHSLEHLSPYEVDKALSEFSRVLKPKGVAYIIVPDLEDVKATDEVLYVSPSGPITGLDMIYGCQRLVESMPYMQHKTGFTAKMLEKAMRKHFSHVVTSRMNHYNLLGIGIR